MKKKPKIFGLTDTADQIEHLSYPIDTSIVLDTCFDALPKANLKIGNSNSLFGLIDDEYGDLIKCEICGREIYISENSNQLPLCSSIECHREYTLRKRNGTENLLVRRCINCGRRFTTGRGSGSKFCSKTCRRSYGKVKADFVSLRRIDRRKTVGKFCLWCGKPTGTKRFCSMEHRQKHESSTGYFHRINKESEGKVVNRFKDSKFPSRRASFRKPKNLPERS